MSLVSDLYGKGLYDDGPRGDKTPVRQGITYDKARGRWVVAPSYLMEPVTPRSNLVRQVHADTRIRRERLARHERTARGQK